MGSANTRADAGCNYCGILVQLHIHTLLLIETITYGLLFIWAFVQFFIFFLFFIFFMHTHILLSYKFVDWELKFQLFDQNNVSLRRHGSS
jgi:hypothetical protein